MNTNPKNTFKETLPSKSTSTPKASIEYTFSIKHTLVKCAFTIFVVFVMVGLSELLNEKEIVFPEITALMIGLTVSQKRSWQVSPIRILLLILICSLLGIFFVRYVSFPLPVNITIAFCICQLILYYSRTTFAPLISAAILPILMGTTSIIYPICAVSFTLLALFCEYILTRLNIRPKEIYTPAPLPKSGDFISIIVCVLTISILSPIVIQLGFRFCIAPPLLVAFTEFCRPACNARKHPFKAVTVIFLCGLAGALCRYVLAGILGLPLTLAAVTATIFMLIIVNCSKCFLPPAGALTILPMIIPYDGILTYPLQILIGVSLFMLISILLNQLRK